MSSARSVRIQRLVLQGRNMTQTEGRLLARGIASALGLADGVNAPSRSMDSLLINLIAPKTLGVDLIAEMVGAELRRKLR